MQPTIPNFADRTAPLIAAAAQANEPFDTAQIARIATGTRRIPTVPVVAQTTGLIPVIAPTTGRIPVEIPTPGRLPTVPMPAPSPGRLPTVPMPGQVLPTVNIPAPSPGRLPTVPMPGQVLPTVNIPAPSPGRLPTVPMPGQVLPTVNIPAPSPGRLPTVPMPGQVLPTVNIPAPGKVTIPTMPGQVPVAPLQGQIPRAPLQEQTPLVVPIIPPPDAIRPLVTPVLPRTPMFQAPTFDVNPIFPQPTFQAPTFDLNPIFPQPTFQVPAEFDPRTVFNANPPLPVALPPQPEDPPEILRVETPGAIALLQQFHPNHMTRPQHGFEVTVLRRNRHLRRFISDTDDASIIVTPHQIIVDRQARLQFDRGPEDEGMRFIADQNYTIKLKGDWTLTPLHRYPDDREGGFIATLSYRLFPRIRIGSQWAIIIDNPIVTYPGPIQLNAEGYIIQEGPQADEFQFTTTDYNSNFFQASIETSRLLHPSLETMIQAAEAIGVFPELRNRNQFGSYLRDATFYEINRIYKGPRVEAARKFLLFMHQASIDAEIERAYRLDVERMPQAQIIQLRDYMRQRHYGWTYLGFINELHPAGQVRVHAYEATLTPEAFQAAITPEQAILMEAWRTRSLQMNVSKQRLKNLLGLREIARKTGYNHAPVLTNVGFPLHEILPRIPLGLLVNDIRNPGEPAINQYGRDMTQRNVASNSEMGKSYYMMLYHEAVRRNIRLRPRR